VDLLGVDTSWVAAAVSVKHVVLFVVVWKEVVGWHKPPTAFTSHTSNTPCPYQFPPLTTVLNCTCWALLWYLIGPLLIQSLLLSAQVFFLGRVLWKACIFPIVSGSLNAPSLVQCILCSRRARPDSADLSFVVHPQKTELSGELNYHPRKISFADVQFEESI
jgi:hypothetical protein